MRFGIGNNQFDLSDVEVAGKVDDLDSILDLSAEVLKDYAGEARDSRMARLARYLIVHFGACPNTDELELATGGLEVYCWDYKEQSPTIGIGDFEVSPDQALNVAALILRKVQALR